jgi:hypothetical protein
MLLAGGIVKIAGDILQNENIKILYAAQTMLYFVKI